MNSGPTLAKGSTGDDVRRLQRILVMIKDLGYTDIDGIFGANTEAAVESFQQGAKLAVDGIVGAKTWAALPADPHTPLLRSGSSGADVHRLQAGLHAYAGGGQGADPGPIDGDFGSRTEHAVRVYQSERGLSVDGVVGDRTWWVPAGAAGATLASLSGATTI
jgi:peptidoglycan hydrolase-like protein with peptidoglycan-binding domain